MSDSTSQLEELRQFASKPPEAQEISKPLLAVLQSMRKYGVPQYEWSDLRPLVSRAMVDSINQFRSSHVNSDPEPKPGVSFDDQKARLVSSLNAFDGAPFTLQRLCELILSPADHYNSTKKLLFGLEKLLSVSTTLEVASETEIKDLDRENDEIRKKKIPVRDIEMKDAPPAEGETVSHQSTNVDMKDAPQAQS
mmetsp:Transcript_12365/g.14193  ORF Transcript_12365/g.14193 Transcript_12365/m.14193 type:complete len:194 (+) Transcript_12365:260-841(+)|eukprot:CAMPEP_0184019736 /NCGR_PEP_ID=MMETSP0954-20121128/8932_1 /TAXON_ID=627963 /ORGANISM="Aplanochytrium sp, Strain PBS07" /LENGTH=193 /DNA_ID=CAMNT_0026301465 /DNA_START=329 /DNA_END=910 /DNA_ORIENTATION=-